MAQKSYIHKPATRPMDGRTLAQLHDYHADLHPQKEAFVIFDTDGNRSVYTFKEVKDKSIEVAALLLQIGIKRGQRVVLKAPSCIEFIWCFLALNRIGAITILLQMYGHSEEGVVAFLQRVKCQTFLHFPTGDTSYDKNLLQSIWKFLDPNMVIDISENNNLKNAAVKSLSDIVEKTPREEENVIYQMQDKVQFDDTALVLQTSGSTGQPKALQYTHHSLVNEAFAAGTYLLGMHKDGSDSRLFNDRAFSYASCVLATLINVFANGCTLVSIPPAISFKGNHTEFILSVLQNEKCTNGIFTSYLIPDLIKCQHTKEYDLSSLRCFFSSGQAIPLHQYTELQKIVPKCTLVYTYAMSELGSIGTRKFDITDPKSLESFDVVPSVEVKIIGDDKAVVPVGEVGEICVRSPLSFSGFLINPKNEFRDIATNGWINTDDAGYIDHHGKLHLLGRMHEVISKGMNKYFPKAIENVLSAYPDVKAVVVMGVPDERLLEEICACVIPKPGSALEKSVAEFDQWVSSQVIADDMEFTKKPKYVLVFQEFPLTKTGKTDRKSLKAIAMQKLGLA